MGNDMEIREMPVGEIIPYENNPRKNEQAVAAVAESIKQCGYVAPIIVDENNVILAGHTRLKAVMSLGGAQIPVIVRHGLTDEQKRKYRILDNKTSEFAEWDFDLLETELEGLDFDGFDFGFDDDTADLFGYIANDEFITNDDGKLTFGLTLELLTSDKEIVDSYIKQNGKEKLVEIVMEEIRNA